MWNLKEMIPMNLFTKQKCSMVKRKQQQQQQDSIWDFPGGAVVKNLTANAGDMGSSPGLGRSHMPRSN